MAIVTEPTVAAVAGADTADLVDVVERFVESLTDVIDRMQCHSCGCLDQALPVELRDTIENQAWRALEAYQACCWIEADLDVPAVAATVRARRTGNR